MRRLIEIFAEEAGIPLPADIREELNKMPTLTTAQAAERLGVSDRRVRQHIATGALRAAKAGRDWLIRERDLARFVPLPGGRPRRSGRSAEQGRRT